AVERVSNFKFLGVYIKDDLTWSMQADSAVKTAQKRLYFLRRLKKFGMSEKTLKNLYTYIDPLNSRHHHVGLHSAPPLIQLHLLHIQSWTKILAPLHFCQIMYHFSQKIVAITNVLVFTCLFLLFALEQHKKAEKTSQT